MRWGYRRSPTHYRSRFCSWSAQAPSHSAFRRSRALDQVLGEDLATILSVDRRGQQSKIQPRSRHPLAQLINSFSPVVHLFVAEARPYIDPAVVAELHAIIEVLKRAAKETVWNEIRPTCPTPHDFRHTIIEFLTIEMLERTYRRVLPVLSTTSQTREPDIKLDLPLPIHLEVKVPQSLVRIPQDVSELGAEYLADLVNRVAKSAVGSDGQIRSDRPGMLVLGGFNLRPEETQRLESSARAYMSRRGQRYPFLASIGVTFLNIGRSPGLNGAARAMPAFNLVRNPNAAVPFP